MRHGTISTGLACLLVAACGPNDPPAAPTSATTPPVVSTPATTEAPAESPIAGPTPPPFPLPPIIAPPPDIPGRPTPSTLRLPGPIPPQ